VATTEDSKARNLTRLSLIFSFALGVASIGASAFVASRVPVWTEREERETQRRLEQRDFRTAQRLVVDELSDHAMAVTDDIEVLPQEWFVVAAGTGGPPSPPNVPPIFRTRAELPRYASPRWKMFQGALAESLSDADWDTVSSAYEELENVERWAPIFLPGVPQPRQNPVGRPFQGRDIEGEQIRRRPPRCRPGRKARERTA
jgi:hypothetical protein